MPILQLAWTRKTVVAGVLGLSALGVWVWRIAITDADHIVLTARLFDTQGNPLAINPLVGIQQLAANDQRAIDIRFPAVSRANGTQGRIEVTLVSWADE